MVQSVRLTLMTVTPIHAFMEENVLMEWIHSHVNALMALPGQGSCVMKVGMVVRLAKQTGSFATYRLMLAEA